MTDHPCPSILNALANRGIEVAYQPRFNLKTNSIIHFEALARWNHPNTRQYSAAVHRGGRGGTGLMFRSVRGDWPN